MTALFNLADVTAPGSSPARFAALKAHRAAHATRGYGQQAPDYGAMPAFANSAADTVSEARER
jgi:hypothetical protein